jgi:PTH1 family peptidyl-tRNA hydrolase
MYSSETGEDEARKNLRPYLFVSCICFDKNLFMEQINPNLSPFLIAGLGNPGRQYKTSRHNIGFMLVNQLAAKLDITFSRVESRALVCKKKYKDRSIILAKPQTFMNLSGQAVGALVKFYKIPLENLMVVYDDVDLPFGKIRIRPSGGSAGQKGVASIIERLGTREFPRLRLGLDRPPGRMQAASYVLRDFSQEEVDFLPEILDRGVDAVLTFVSLGLVTAMNQYNSSVNGESE